MRQSRTRLRSVGLDVLAVDMVGNENAVGIDVVFRNSAIDTTAPTAFFAASPENAILSGTVTVQVQAADDVAVQSVSIRIGAATPGPATFNPATGFYEFAWATASFQDGSYRLEAVVVDTSGNRASAVPVQVRVDNTAPVASLSTPIAGERVSGVFVFRVFATDVVGVRSVTLTVFGTTVPMAFNAASGYYEYVIDSRSVPDGTYSATATVEDLSGRATTSAAVSFAVRNGVPMDYVRALLDVTLFLIFLFFVVAFVVLLRLGRRGSLAKWLGRAGGSTRAPPKAPKDEGEL